MDILATEGFILSVLTSLHGSLQLLSHQNPRTVGTDMESDMCKHGEVAAVVQLYKAKLLNSFRIHTFCLVHGSCTNEQLVACIPVQDVKDDHYETYHEV